MRRRARVSACALLALATPAAASGAHDALWHHRNRGKAFYENPTTHREAVDEFKRALDLAPGSVRERVNYALALLRAGRTDEGVAELRRAQQQDPAVPHTWFNLGIFYKNDGQYEQAVAQFEQMVKLAPRDAVSRYNLGYLYKLTGHPVEALAELERAARLDPNLAAPRFQLANTYRAAGRAEDAAREQAAFMEIKRRQAGAAVPEDLDWSTYAEILDPPEPAAVDDGPAPKPSFDDERVGQETFDPERSGLLVLDAGGDGSADLLVWSPRGVRLFRGGSARAAASGLDQLEDVRAIAAGDYDDDGLPDLCVLTGRGAVLYANRRGAFAPAAKALPAGAEGAYAAAVWLDYDHDYDADLLLVGRASKLLRNNGEAGFSDETAAFPFVAGRAVDVLLFGLVSDTSGHDVVVTYADRGGVLYRDRLAGKYEAQPLDLLPAGARGLRARDLDADGAFDLVAGGAPGLTLLRNTGEAFEALPAPPQRARSLALADIENRALPDVLVDGAVLRNTGRGRLAAPAHVLLEDAAVMVAADFSGDGRTDVAALAGDGSLHLLRNRTASKHAWVRVALTGVKNPKLAPQAVVEVKAGRWYQKQGYDGLPLVFGVNAAQTLDTVRITWPNGLIQNEIDQPVGRTLSLREAPRLSGSCPMIFTWDGRGFRFITDVLGVAPLGASSGDGTYFPVDHDEYVQVPGEALVARRGAYEVRITEELREVSYLDQVQLIAVDHPAKVDVFTNDKFKSPPFPEFRLFGVARRVYPRAARDGAGDAAPALRARDRVYAGGFTCNGSGVAGMHALELDFGDAAPDNRAVLVLNGWVDWADGSTFLAMSQADPRGLVLPSLQVKDSRGEWRTVVEDMGMPAGKPKTIAVDLTERFLSDSREVRLSTNLCLYWDEIFLGQSATPPDVALTPLDAVSADLHFRGFSTPLIHPRRAQPETFDYARLVDLSNWNPTAGLYTRYGDVRPLVSAADDRLVVMGSGDELTLRFPAAGLPPLPDGWGRDFLLLVDGWAKDADANTAYGTSVEPLPFHAMSAYPYPPPEHFPDDAASRAYRATYNTRPALRLIRPLRGER